MDSGANGANVDRSVLFWAFFAQNLILLAMFVRQAFLDWVEDPLQWSPALEVVNAGIF